jgi:4-hydroxy-tetrahydrodipicolinate reductase
MKYVMLNGLPGKMATAVAELIVNQGGPDYKLACIALTGPDVSDNYYPYSIREGVDLIHPGKLDDSLPRIGHFLEEGHIFAVDFTQPSAAVENTKLYCRLNMPFVMGTTGGDRAVIDKLVRESSISAVIAPNMAAQVVAFQAMIEYAAENFPKVFEGFAISITESHQRGKQDTSGTAKAVMGSLEKLGLDIDSCLRMIRDPDEQLILGVAPEHLKGHGWHDYGIASHDGSMSFRFVHNVSGRKPYAVGTLKALAFLRKKIEEGSKGEVFSMIDVLRG